jgi:hypothetical protein
MQFFSDSKLKTLTGMTLAGADLAIPEGNFFCISASLRPSASFKDIQEKVEQKVRLLVSADADLSMFPMLSQQLAESLTTIPNLASLKAQLPAGEDPAMLEGNIGLEWGLNEYCYGQNKAVLAKNLSALTVQELQRAAKKFLLGTNGSITTLRPATP